MSRLEDYSARSCDDLLLRNRALIEQADAVIADAHRMGQVCADLSERSRTRGLRLRQVSRDMQARLMEIRAGTEDRCRRSQLASVIGT